MVAQRLIAQQSRIHGSECKLGDNASQIAFFPPLDDFADVLLKRSGNGSNGDSGPAGSADYFESIEDEEFVVLPPSVEQENQQPRRYANRMSPYPLPRDHKSYKQPLPAEKIRSKRKALQEKHEEVDSTGTGPSSTEDRRNITRLSLEALDLSTWHLANQAFSQSGYLEPNVSLSTHPVIETCDIPFDDSRPMMRGVRRLRMEKRMLTDRELEVLQESAHATVTKDSFYRQPSCLRICLTAIRDSQDNIEKARLPF